MDFQLFHDRKQLSADNSQCSKLAQGQFVKERSNKAYHQRTVQRGNHEISSPPSCHANKESVSSVPSIYIERKSLAVPAPAPVPSRKRSLLTSRDQSQPDLLSGLNTMTSVSKPAAETSSSILDLRHHSQAPLRKKFKLSSRDDHNKKLCTEADVKSLRRSFTPSEQRVAPDRLSDMDKGHEPTGLLLDEVMQWMRETYSYQMSSFMREMLLCEVTGDIKIQPEHLHDGPNFCKVSVCH